MSVARNDAWPVNINSHRGVELCGRCGHALDHRGKRCDHPVTVRRPISKEEQAARGISDEYEIVEQACGCPDGVRTDVLQCRQNAEMIQQNRLILDALSDVFAVLLKASSLEVDKEGNLKPAHGGLVV